MKVSLIICTYMRPEPLSRLMDSVMLQSKLPDEVLIIDGSTNDDTGSRFRESGNPIIHYYKVPKEHRGLTKQRNFGINKVAPDMDIVAFLDDDTILEKEYFSNLIKAYKSLPNASGIGGVATNENRWGLKENKDYDKNTFYTFENYVVKESSRNILRNKLGLASNVLPSVMPAYSHGRTFSYPLTSDNYPVDLLVGMSMSFRKKVIDSIKFSTYFEGYGLYEDA
ncbi:MAG: glycosyltransferase family A protein, partial [Nonlabens sp.]